MPLTRESTVFVAGHGGMVGSAIVRALDRMGVGRVLTADRQALDLTRQSRVAEFMADQRIDQVVAAAARVGGIHANDAYPADFLYENLMIEANLIHAAHLAGIHELLFLGSSCIYPRLADQPIAEEALLTGALEPTNEPYAIAKIAGIKLCEGYNRQFGRSYRSLMPANLYGVGDNFHPEDSHVIPALLRRFDAALGAGVDAVTLWGTGRPRREFLHVDDLANACLHVMALAHDVWQGCVQPRMSHLNVGSGVEHSIAELAHLVARIVGFEGRIVFDASKPDGTPRKLLDSGRIRRLGWLPRIDLESGLRDTLDWYRLHRAEVRGG